MCRLKISTKGCILGLEDGINERNHTTSAKCVSLEAVIIKIKISEFNRKMEKDPLFYNLIMD